MRQIILSDAIWLHPPSGYSKIAEQLCQLFAKDGHDVAHVPIREGIHGTSMMKGHNLTYKNTLLLDSGPPGDVMSEGIVLGHYYDFKADFVLTLKDLWNFRTLPEYPINWIPVVPIDHKPVSKEVIARLKAAFQIVTITRFGKRELRKVGLPSTYIPLFANSEHYKPFDEAGKKDARNEFGIPQDSFAILINAMNRRRKMIPRILKACRRFLENNPDAKETKIVMWTDLLPEFFTEDAARGTMLSHVVRNLDLNNFVIAPDRELYGKGIEEYRMPTLYNAVNCILCASAEGFWMPGIESGMCGIPAVVVEWAAAPEVTTGVLAKVADMDVMNPIGYEQPLVDIDSMAEGIEKIYNGDRERFAKEARRYSLKYDQVEVYTKYWRPFLEKIEPMIKPYIKKGGKTESWTLQ